MLGKHSKQGNPTVCPAFGGIPCSDVRTVGIAHACVAVG